MWTYQPWTICWKRTAGHPVWLKFPASFFSVIFLSSVGLCYIRGLVALPFGIPPSLSPLPCLPLKNSDHFCWLRVCVVTLGRHFHQPNQPVHSSFHLSCWESCVEHPPHCLLHSCHVHVSFVFPLALVLLFLLLPPFPCTFLLLLLFLVMWAREIPIPFRRL